jgi:hypothetical protein
MENPFFLGSAFCLEKPGRLKEVVFLVQAVGSGRLLTSGGDLLLRRD